MRLVISRRVRLFASIATAGLLLVGCGSSPGQPGAAAVVGETEIPLSQVKDWFNAVLEKEPALKPQLQKQGQLDELSRQLTSYSVQQELVRQAAEREGVRVSEQKISEDIEGQGGPVAATAGTINTPENLRASTRTKLLAVELGRKYLDRTSITFDFTQATTRREAEDKARRMSQGAEESAEVLEADRKSGVPVSLNKRIVAADQADLAAASPLFGAEPGTVIAFETQQQSGQWLVARIKERRTDASPATPAPPQPDQQTLQSFGMRLLGVVADASGVQVSPRYGVWDPVALSAAPNENETLGFWFDADESAH